MDSSVFFIFALVVSGTSFAFLLKCFFSLVVSGTSFAFLFKCFFFSSFFSLGGSCYVRGRLR